jgi:hypothetical protein
MNAGEDSNGGEPNSHCRIEDGDLLSRSANFVCEMFDVERFTYDRMPVVRSIDMVYYRLA